MERRGIDMTGIVDYNAGNIKSVERALESLNIKYIRSKNPKDFKDCDRLIFPGVGEAAYAMEQLNSSGLADFLREWVNSKKPLLGICLGSQIIFDYSEESDTKCLGFIPGKIRHFSNLWQNSELKVPHMGWNNISYTNGGCPLFKDVAENSDFYFVHSYVIQPQDESVIKGVCEYEIKVPSCVQKENIYAFQFHPEKSGVAGLTLLKNYCTGTISTNGEIVC